VTTELAYLYPQDDDDVYRDVIADHAHLTIEALIRRIARCRAIASNALMYGQSCASLARRVGQHAESTLLAKARGKKVVA